MPISARFFKSLARYLAILVAVTVAGSATAAIVGQAGGRWSIHSFATLPAIMAYATPLAGFLAAATLRGLPGGPGLTGLTLRRLGPGTFTLSVAVFLTLGFVQPAVNRASLQQAGVEGLPSTLTVTSAWEAYRSGIGPATKDPRFTPMGFSEARSRAYELGWQIHLTWAIPCLVLVFIVAGIAFAARSDEETSTTSAWLGLSALAIPTYGLLAVLGELSSTGGLMPLVAAILVLIPSVSILLGATWPWSLGTARP